MGLQVAQTAFFETGASADFDLQGIWQRLNPMDESPWSLASEIPGFLDLPLDGKFAFVADLRPKQGLIEATGFDEDVVITLGDEDALDTVQEAFDPTFQQVLTFSDNVINYDFYLA